MDIVILMTNWGFKLIKRLLEASPRRWGIGVVVAAGLATAPMTVSAQIRTDGSLGGRATTLSSATGPSVVTIAPNLGHRAGGNLFHSFDAFSVSAHQTARFTAPSSVVRIISRVTGDSISTIAGTVSAPASFYLFNPNGVVVTSTGRFDVNGSLFLSTANQVRWQDGALYTTDLSRKVTFTAAAPVAYGFLGAPLGRIRIGNTALAVPDGQTLALIGRDVRIETGRDRVYDSADNLLLPLTLSAPQGRILVTAIGSQAGEVRLSDGRSTVSPTGTVSFQGITASSSGTNGGTTRLSGGTVAIRASELRSDTVATAGGGLTVTATDQVRLTGTNLYSSSTGTGTAGTLRIEAPKVTLDGTPLTTTTEGSGDAGIIRIRATDRLILANGSGLDSTSNAEGDGGEIHLSAGTITISGGASQINSTSSGGNAGDIRLEATDRIRINDGAAVSADSSGRTGEAGTITMTARQVEIAGGATVRAGVFYSKEGGGDIVVEGKESIIIKENALLSTNSEYEEAIAGDLRLTAPRISLESGAFLQSESNASSPTASAGRIHLTGSFLSVTGGSEISTRAISAGGGTITLEADRVIGFTQAQATTSVTSGIGDGGNITLRAPLLTLDQAVILANAQDGRGGQIRLSAQLLQKSPDTLISAISSHGIDGEVTTTGLDSSTTSPLSHLSAAYIDPASRLSQGCPGAGGRIRLARASRGPLRSQPDEMVPVAILAGGRLQGSAPSAPQILGCRPSMPGETPDPL